MPDALLIIPVFAADGVGLVNNTTGRSIIEAFYVTFGVMVFGHYAVIFHGLLFLPISTMESRVS